MTIEDKKRLENLVTKAKDGDMDAKEEILKYYKKVVLYNSKKYFIKGYDCEDLISEGYNAVLLAIVKYNVECDCFYTYGVRAIENRLKYLLRSSIEPEDKAAVNITDEIEDFLQSNDMAVEDMAYVNMLKGKIEKLHKDESEIIKKIYLRGETIKEIAKDKGVTYSRVQYLRNRGLCNLRGLV